MQPEFTPRDENTKIFHDLFRTKRTLGILTTKRLPRISAMKFFQSFGAIRSTIGPEEIEIMVDETQLNQLIKFHAVLFRDVLTTWQSFFVHDSQHSFIIVPTTGATILWDIVQEFQQLQPLYEKSTQERYNVEYRPEDWLYRVVCPWYRADQTTRHIVTKVHEHLTPFSDFPNPSHETYASYVKDKYKQQVEQSRQFLIEVKPVTQKLNRLHSGEGEDGKKNSSIRGPELLIPELCHNFHFPGDLWLKLIILPSVLHRMFYCLHAEQLRLHINNYVGLKVIDYQPKPVPERMNRRPQKNSNDRHAEISYMQTNQNKNDKQIIDRESISSRLSCPWNDYEEPIDLHRNLDRIFSLEIDYHHEFISRGLRALTIIGEEEDEVDDQDIRARYISNMGRKRNQPMAICDANTEEKMLIEILNVTDTQIGVEQHELLAAITAASSGDIFDSERLEVLGDAFLKFGVSVYLTQTHVNWHEGHLTSVKGQLVSNRNLFYLADRIHLPGILKINKFSPKDDWIPPMVRAPAFVQVLFCIKRSTKYIY